MEEANKTQKAVKSAQHVTKRKPTPSDAAAHNVADHDAAAHNVADHDAAACNEQIMMQQPVM